MGPCRPNADYSLDGLQFLSFCLLPLGDSVHANTTSSTKYIENQKKKGLAVVKKININ